MSDALTGGNEVKTGASSDINVYNSYDSVKVPSVFEIQNVVNRPVSCWGYSVFLVLEQLFGLRSERTIFETKKSCSQFNGWPEALETVATNSWSQNSIY